MAPMAEMLAYMPSTLRKSRNMHATAMPAYFGRRSSIKVFGLITQLGCSDLSVSRSGDMGLPTCGSSA